MQNNESKSIKLYWQKIIPSQELKSPSHSEFLNKNGGIYLWIFDGTPNRVCYIGEAGFFSDRLEQHKSNFEKAYYSYYNIEKSEDWLSFIKEHLHGMKMNEVNSLGKMFYPQNSKPTKDDSTPEQKEKSKAYFQHLKFAFATIEPEPKNQTERQKIEAALIFSLRKYYKDQTGGLTLALVDKNGREKDALLGKANPHSTRFTFEHLGEVVEKLPSEFRNIVCYEP
jgi:hypothetical protein